MPQPHACPSARPGTSGAIPDGLAHMRWPTRIAKLEGRCESLCASFVPSCLCGWPWLPCYNYKLIIMVKCGCLQNPAPGKLPLPEFGTSGSQARPASRPTHPSACLAAGTARRMAAVAPDGHCRETARRRGPRALGKIVLPPSDLRGFAPSREIRDLSPTGDERRCPDVLVHSRGASVRGRPAPRRQRSTPCGEKVFISSKIIIL